MTKIQLAVCFFVMVCQFNMNVAELKSCSEQHDKLELCFTQKGGYKKPLPLVLDTFFYLKAITDVDEDKNSISIQAELWCIWKDPGLALSAKSSEERFEIEEEIGALIWRPIISFENIKKSKDVRLFGERDTFFFQYEVNHTGHPKLVYAEQYELTISCHFQFGSFPFDSHKCRIEFGDFCWGTSLLNLSATTIQLRDYPDVTVENGPMMLKDFPYPYKFQLESLPGFATNVGGWPNSFTGARLTLERKSIGSLMSGYYYPTTAFAILSMISYLIDADIVPGRMGMIVTLYLISANVYSSVEAPKARGFSYIEVWMIGTQFPILLALFEYGLILYWKKIANKSGHQNDIESKEKLDEQIKCLDFTTMIFSLVSFIMFAIFYWIGNPMQYLNHF